MDQSISVSFVLSHELIAQRLEEGQRGNGQRPIALNGACFLSHTGHLLKDLMCAIDGGENRCSGN
jgi:hypothetical protein